VSEESIGGRIRAVRGGIPQDEFAKKYGLNRNTLGRYEKGTNDPSASFLKALIEDLGLDANWLLFGVGELPKPELTSVEAALLDNFRHCPEDEQDAIVKTSALLAKSKAKALKKTG
jgi:transcriptional regulator with XRE-family HTH domain